MKLVRDLIPAIILEAGKTPEWRYTRSREEYADLLAQKVVEELKEYMGTLTYDEAVEEAGDLYEVFRTLLSVKGISVEHAREAAEEKRQSRGGFKAGIVLKSVRE